MNDRNSIIKNERYLGYLMGAGVALMILALLLEGLGTIDNGTTTGSIFVVGLALFLLGLLTWLYMFRPWQRFDDLKTPQYTGDHAADKAEQGVKAAVAETAKAAKAVAEESAQVASGAAAKVSAAVPEVGALATVPTPQKAIEPHVILMPPPKVEDAAQAAAGAVKGTAKAVVEAAESVEKEITQAAAEVVETPSRSAAPAKPDDLTIIEGIGPKTNKALQAAGVTTFAALAAMTPAAISALLVEAKVRIVSPPDTWPRQAKLAADGDMDGLKALQAKLKGGILKD